MVRSHRAEHFSSPRLVHKSSADRLQILLPLGLLLVCNELRLVRVHRPQSLRQGRVRVVVHRVERVAVRRRQVVNVELDERLAQILLLLELDRELIWFMSALIVIIAWTDD